MAIKNQIQLRRGSSSEWIVEADGDGPILASGEPGFDLTNNILKLGNGTTRWKDLQPIGADQSLYKVKNTSGGTIYKGQLVRADGTVGNSDAIKVTTFIADGSVPEYTIMGLALQQMEDNDFGYVTAFGQIRGVNTDPANSSTNICAAGETWADGDILYASPSVSGKLTKIKPQHETIIAIVLHAANNGSLFARPTWYPHMNDIHDVSTSGVANNDYLKYDSAISTWVPDSFEDNVMALLPTSVKGTFLLTEPSGTFSVDEGYTVGTLDVFLNGVKLSSYAGDYIADDAQTFTLSEIAPSGSIIEYLALIPSNNNPVGGGINLTSASTAPSNPSVGDMWFNTDTGNLFIYIDDGNSSNWLEPFGPAGPAGSGIFASVEEFNTGVSGLLPITDIVSGDNISITSSGTVYTVSVSGQLGLTTEQVDDRVASLLSPASGIVIDYDDNNNLLYISTSGLQPSGNYSLEGHNHIISDISGLQISLDSKQPSGTYASGIHTHLVSDIIDFNSEVSGLLPVKDIVGGSGILIEISSGIYTIAATGTSVSSTTSFSRGWFLS